MIPTLEDTLCNLIAEYGLRALLSALSAECYDTEARIAEYLRDEDRATRWRRAGNCLRFLASHSSIPEE